MTGGKKNLKTHVFIYLIRETILSLLQMIVNNKFLKFYCYVPTTFNSHNNPLGKLTIIIPGKIRTSREAKNWNICSRKYYGKYHVDTHTKVDHFVMTWNKMLHVGKILQVEKEKCYI